MQQSDTALEKRVNAAISALKLTRIIVAHRPETIASADRVISLDKQLSKSSSTEKTAVFA